MEWENKKTAALTQERNTAWTTSLWLDETQKIASFHEMDGGARMDFQDQKRYRSFLDGLVDQRYRFQ
jgi:hypothetical protein